MQEEAWNCFPYARTIINHPRYLCLTCVSAIRIAWLSGISTLTTCPCVRACVCVRARACVRVCVHVFPWKRRRETVSPMHIQTSITLGICVYMSVVNVCIRMYFPARGGVNFFSPSRAKSWTIPSTKMCVCLCIHMHIHTCIHKFTYTYEYAYTYTFVHAQIQALLSARI